MFVVPLLALAVAMTRPALADAPRKYRLWVYCSANLLSNESVARTEELFRRAAKAGYSTVLLTDAKFSHLADMKEPYFQNVERIKKLAAELGLEIVPGIFPVGYSSALLWNNPNLAEALPVRDAPFIVKDGNARIEADTRELIRPDWKDGTVVPDGDGWRISDLKTPHARIVFKLKVRPFAQYHVSLSIKTQEFGPRPALRVLTETGRGLVFSNLGVKRTQNWTLHHAVFNSLDNDQVSLYFGCWSSGGGTMWFKDLRMEEVGLLNLVRRPGSPLIVKRENGEALVEGKDFEPVADPKMGRTPWKGEYDIWHEPPAIRTNLPNGTRLLVSYHHVVTTDDGKVMICPSEPATLELLRDAAQRAHGLWGAKAYFMNHDEIRVLNQDDACARRGLDAGALLADHVRACVRILREVNPEGEIIVWSDMFDPHHNAKRDYYLVRGDLTGSWEGLDRDVIVCNWNSPKPDESLAWFAARGHRQLIAGYYDSRPENVRRWLEAAAKVPNVVGIMYTTWQKKYDDLESFARIVAGD